MPAPLCKVCEAEMIRIPPEALPPHARSGPSMWYCPERQNTSKHPLGTGEG